MCSECHQHPCHPRCPNAPDPKTVYICSGCGWEIYEGDDYWDILGEQFCGESIRKAKREAERDFICFNCGHKICEGDDYWDLMDKQFCEKCVEAAKREAAYDDDADFR